MLKGTMRSVCGVVAALLLMASSAVALPEEPYDPIEPVNRGIFWFNDQLDVYVLEPISRGYRDYVPKPVRTGVNNFFLNLRYPSYLVSDIIQGKFEQVLDHTGRFLINSTVGIGGLIDFAKDWGLPDHEEDFGLALAYHGVPAGPYLVVPLIGPSNVRDGVGRIVDAFLDPIGWVAYTNVSGGTKLAVAATALGMRTVNTRAGLLQAIEAAKEGSVDYYLFVQGAYYQNRYGLLTDGADVEDEVLKDEPQDGFLQ
jgi:phospholipid-binding lipoprotein MlaA